MYLEFIHMASNKQAFLLRLAQADGPWRTLVAIGNDGNAAMYGRVYRLNPHSPITS